METVNCTPTQIDGISCPVKDWPGDIEGRMCFLNALQAARPDFWKSLNDLWRGRDTSKSQSWADARGVRDDWFMQAIVDTLGSWESEPAGPSARLEPGYLWFQHIPDVEFPNFAPNLSEPFPKAVWPAGFDKSTLYRLPASEITTLGPNIESLEDFEARLTAEFRSQLKSYIKKIKGMMNYGTSPQRWDHAQWTARVFMGESRAAISRELTHYSAAEDSVSRAVTRFAKEIGLTLPNTPIPT